jgi:hypothetical protein
MDIKTESAMEFFLRMNTALADEYKFEGQKYIDLCHIIAIVIGKKLLHEGKLPYIERFTAPGTRNKQLVPIRYNRVSWGEHAVCICEEMAWDPVLSKPQPKISYSKELFGEELPLRFYWSTSQIRGYDERNITLLLWK